MKLTDAQVIEGMTRLGVTPQDFRVLQTAPTLDAANKMLDELKVRVKKSFRRAAMELHPDKNGGDEAKTEEFKRLSALVDEVDKLKMYAAPPPRMPFAVPGVRVVRVTYGGSSTASTTSTTTSGVYGGWSGWPY